MKGNNDCKAAARELFPRATQSGIAGVALVAVLFGVYSKTIHAADIFPKAGSGAESVEFSLPKVGLSQHKLRSSPNRGDISTAISFSDQTAIRGSEREYDAALRVAVEDTSFLRLSAGRNIKGTVGCSDKDGHHPCLSRRLASRSGTERTVNTVSSTDASNYMVIAAADLSARPRESAARVLYTDTPGHKGSDVVSGIGEPTSPVSEPKIYVMMLAGLGLMGFVASRRQS